ncbi:hypothetical protein V1477_019657 [Vespula maculifrons]|uniref:Uncharacterized protein n=1 Tax=Vespula maculifrons TaxID=7453 RepID=A0ABD2ARP1_VESMC
MFPITVGQNFVNKSEHIPYICSPGESLCNVKLTLLEIPLVSRAQSFVGSSGSKQLLTFPFDFTSLNTNIRIDRCNPLGLYCKIHDASRYTLIHVAASQLETISPLLPNKVFLGNSGSEYLIIPLYLLDDRKDQLLYFLDQLLYFLLVPKIQLGNS